MRKAYIVQYTPAGAVKLEGDPASTDLAAARRTSVDDPAFQYPMLRDGYPTSEPG